MKQSAHRWRSRAAALLLSLLVAPAVAQPLAEVPHVTGAPRIGIPTLGVTRDGISLSEAPGEPSKLLKVLRAMGGWQTPMARVMTLKAGALSVADLKGGAQGFLIEPLYDALRDRMSWLKMMAHRQGADLSGEIQLVVHGEVPYATLMRVLYTAGQSEFSELIFVVQGPEGPGVIPVDVPKIGTLRPGEDGTHGEMCLAPRGHVTPRGARWRAMRQSVNGVKMLAVRATDERLGPEMLKALSGELGGKLSGGLGVGLDAATLDDIFESGARPIRATRLPPKPVKPPPPPAPTPAAWTPDDLCVVVPAKGGGQDVAALRTRLADLQALETWCEAGGMLSASEVTAWRHLALVLSVAREEGFALMLAAGMEEEMTCSPTFWPPLEGAERPR